MPDLKSVKEYLLMDADSTDFDGVLLELMNSADDDLKRSGVASGSGGLYSLAVKVFVKAHFGERNDYERLIAAYSDIRVRLVIGGGTV